MGGKAMGQGQKGPKPLFLALAKLCYVIPSISPTDNRANGNNHDINWHDLNADQTNPQNAP
jgi:hypothetical protein